MKKILKVLIVLAFPVYISLCLYLYFMQEKIIFHPSKLSKNFKFNFNQAFEEIYLTAQDGIELHSLLFKAENPKGIILYLHGNSSTLEECGKIAKTYTDLGHDIFMLDYRGYGKSDGEIFSEKQFYDDVRLAYNKVKSLYAEDKITVIGFSVGTAAAAMLASTNSPKQLILKAPYFSVVDMTERRYPFSPTTFLLKYKFKTHYFVKRTKAKVTIFHGNQDETIYYGASLKLQKKFKQGDQLITLDGLGHHGFEDNQEYLDELGKLMI